VIAGMAPEKALHLFDTFGGHPEDDALSGGHKAGEFNANVDEVREFLAGHKVVYHVGRFPETTGSLPPGARFSFVHLDADTYQSTATGIDYFWRRLQPGGVIIFDDFGWDRCPGVAKGIGEKLPGVRIGRGQYQAWAVKD
ncbi:MAG TPA: class I SAM-dependent methyltransferase, partial [Gemmataceae bacterium]|nr:class I SAM-dependent methyltransferase [Gemmataceae bacterium]